MLHLTLFLLLFIYIFCIQFVVLHLVKRFNKVPAGFELTVVVALTSSSLEAADAVAAVTSCRPQLTESRLCLVMEPIWVLVTVR